MASNRSKGSNPKRTEAKDGPVDTRLVRVLSHPLRQRILGALHDRVASPVELSRELEEPIGNVSYHVKKLEELGAVELVRTQPVRGALEHFYRARLKAEFDQSHWSRLPASVRQQLFDQNLQRIWEHVVEASDEDGFGDPKTHVSLTDLDLDQEGYDAVAEAMAEALERVKEIQAEAQGRLAGLPDGEREARRTEVVMLHFERASE